jgi:hypothetical protein
MQGSGSFRLIVRRGPQPNQIYELNKDVITLGRDITNDIVINDPEVSRHHCRMTRSGGGYTLEDLGSTNGTFVNGQRLGSPRPLNNNEMIGLGETVTLVYEAALAGVSPDFSPRPVISGGQPPAPSYGSYAPPAGQAYPPPPSSPVAGPAPYSAPSSGPSYGGANVPPVGSGGSYVPGQQSQTLQQQIYQPGQAPQPGALGGQGYQQFGQQYPSPGYQPYPDQPIQQSQGLGRWFFIGCGCFIVACIVLGIVGALVVDSNQELRCSLPIVRQIYTTLNPRSCP